MLYFCIVESRDVVMLLGLELPSLAGLGLPATRISFLGKMAPFILTLRFFLDRLDIDTNTYTSQDLKSALAKFKEGVQMENSKEDKVCDILFRKLVYVCRA